MFSIFTFSITGNLYSNLYILVKINNEKNVFFKVLKTKFLTRVLWSANLSKEKKVLFEKFTVNCDIFLDSFLRIVFVNLMFLRHQGVFLKIINKLNKYFSFSF